MTTSENSSEDQPNKAETKRKVGQPTIYTPEVGQEICDRLAAGESLNAICKSEHLPAESTVRAWTLIADHPISANYARAREAGYLKMADELLNIADDGTNDYTTCENKDGEPYKKVDHDHIARSRLRVETRKWLLSKCLPKVYGDKIEVGGRDGAAIQHAVQVTFVGSKPSADKG